MRKLLRSALVILPLLLAGCFYENPLTPKPSDNLNTWLLGEWEHRDKSGAVSRAIVTPLSADIYSVQVSLAKRGGVRHSYNFEAWGSRVGAYTFHTLQSMQAAPDLPEGAFVFLHAQLIDQNTIVLRSPALTAPQNASSYTLRTEIRSRLKDNSLYTNSNETTWTRSAEAYWQRDGATGLFRPLRYKVPDSIRKSQ